MSGAAFLLIAVAVALIGTLLVMARNRPGHRANDAMAEFRREMQALAPPHAEGEERPTARRPYPGVEQLRDDDGPASPDGPRPDAGSGAR